MILDHYRSLVLRTQIISLILAFSLQLNFKQLSYRLQYRLYTKMMKRLPDPERTGRFRICIFLSLPLGHQAFCTLLEQVNKLREAAKQPNHFIGVVEDG